ncbi:quinone oxidoreductase family protein [Cellulomonas aerilata]|uniref:Putative oxidoreductase n=1 Tax=Cellulomonas aerilata TaxID=515326 RepID=A0A512DEH9_9CELL|nr:NADP-dependent oxidoreductase [Cellulomonas aerilata]GEO34856.1 putative oxidoreductase [Cellulomonas aerilata]
MTRAVVAPSYGGPEVLTIVDVDPGRPGPGQVLLEVRAAGVNPADWKTYSGVWGTDPARLPLRLGFEATGVVVDAGPGDHGVRVGDEVLTPADGAYADRVLVRAADVVAKPPSLDWAAAGGLLLTGATAAHTVEATGVAAGDTVLVHGASGGVGAMVVQLVLERGARVIGTARRSRLDAVAELGAVPVEYGPGLADRVRALAPDGVQAAVDTAGTDEALDVSVELVADRARVATIAAFARGGELGIQVLGNGPGADPGTAVRAAARPRLAELAGTGRLRVRVAATFPLADVAEAHRLGMAGGATGKIVLLP